MFLQDYHYYLQSLSQAIQITVAVVVHKSGCRLVFVRDFYAIGSTGRAGNICGGYRSVFLRLLRLRYSLPLLSGQWQFAVLSQLFRNN